MTQTNAQRLADAFRYEPDTGFLYWKNASGNGRIKPGTKAGCLTECGGIKITFQRKGYFAHHIVWLMHHGTLPSKFIDHKNGNRADNRIENLRECEQWQNMQNLKESSCGSAGIRGAHKYRNGRWASAIIVKGQKQWLGTFGSADEAAQAYREAKRQLHQFNPEVRK